MRGVRSVRNQLLLWLVVPSIALWIAGGVGAYRISAGLVQSTHDDALEDSARTLASRVRVAESSVNLDMSDEALNVLREDPNDLIYYQIRGPDGAVVSGESDLPNPPAALEKLSFHDANYRGQDVRICTLRFVPDRGRPDSFVIVQVAETLRSRTAIIANTIKVITPALALIITVAAVAAWFGIKRGLSSLDLVRQTVSRRSYFDLDQIDEANSPLEVQPLVHEINNLLRRLSEGKALHHRFIENAAHQLRTPLAGLKAHFQLALRDPAAGSIPALSEISSGLDRVSRLVNQLLSLARAEPGAAELSMSKVDLEDLVKDAARDMVPQANRAKVDLGFEGAGKEVPVHGDPVSLHDLVINLIDNAVRYSGPGSSVTARVDGGPSPAFIVEDTGPGIRPAELERVVERFYRGQGMKAEGSGLGLAIVSEIAQRHGAKFTIENKETGSGIIATVRFGGQRELSI